MQQATVDVLSGDDAFLIETHQLEKVIGVYRIKKGYIRLLRWFAYFCFIFGGIVLVIVLTLIVLSGNHALMGSQQLPHDPIQAWLLSQEKQTPDEDLMSEYLSPIFGVIFSLIFGLLIWRLGVPSMERERVIVCEKGLLYLKRKIMGDHIDVVRWEEVLEIKNDPIGLEYSIVCQDGESISLSFAFQRIGELIALVRQYSEVEDR